MSDKEEGKKKISMGVVMERMKKLPVSLWKTLYQVGRDDPRRVIHALKVGTALTLVSLLYLLEPLFEGVGQNAMWAVMTVVVVLEFTAGATLCKGLNRGLGTMMAGSLSFLIDYVAEESGKVCRAVFIGVSVFLIGSVATYVRFIPHIKKNYDYGVLVFILTFNLITVSSFRVTNVLKIARERVYNIAIGCGICLCMTLLILPNWSGRDLHKSTVDKLEVLARSIQACVHDYFEDNIDEMSSQDDIKKGYKTVLDSKATDESLALFASWEPRYSMKCSRYPWHRYVKLGTILRHFAYTAVSLHGCLESEIQTPLSIRSMFREPCINVASEATQILMHLANSIRNREQCCSDTLSDRLQEALHNLNCAIKSQPRLFISSGNHNSTSNFSGHLKNDHHSTSNFSGYLKKDHHSSANFSGGLKNDKASPSFTSPSLRNDAFSATLEYRSKRFIEQSKQPGDKRVLNTTLSKLAITSLEFSEALPFAAFASLLVEMVARLDLVIREVEELGRAAHFKKSSEIDEIKVDMKDEFKMSNMSLREMPSDVRLHGAE
ncbi:Aluminum-activated malate transporter protein [Dioscorea alata]|uniref:Aluminum-activated malate transporter protein n=1 Tax=Dioscorea alata TaxID=55571 RepID=A0ACB7WI05_DIOAL|nr:Aluminum-activated malate transporter protein [Dioscorea alata]